jgi:DNA-binding XRE family transcriptional regulator
LKHRHLALPPAVEAGELPSAAVVDLLDRGGLDDWRPLATAVAAEPDGPFAARLERLIDAYPMYGTSSLWRAWIDRCRARRSAPLLPAPARTLAATRRRYGLTQEQLAERLGMSQSDLSKLERRNDVRLSSLRAWAASLRGRLRVLFERDGERIEVRLQGSRDSQDA